MDAVTSHPTLEQAKESRRTSIRQFILSMVIPSAIAAIASALIFFHFSQKSAEEVEKQTTEQLSMVAQGISDHVRGTIYGYQALVHATALNKADALSSLLNVPGVKFFSEISTHGDRPVALVRVSVSGSNVAQIEKTISQQVLQTFSGQTLSGGKLKKGESRMVLVRPDDQQSREWIGFFYAVSDETYSGIWVDPVEAFSIAKKKGQPNQQSYLVKLALVSQQGRVLSASVSEYSGGDFSGVKGFSAFQKDPNLIQNQSAADDWTIRVFRKLADFPLYVIAEKAEERSGGWVRLAKDPELRNRILGFFFLFCGAWGFVSFFIAWNMRKRIPAVPVTASAPVTVYVPAPVVEAIPVAVLPEAPAPVPVQNPAIFDQAVADEWRLRKYLDEEKLISDFERRSFLSKTPRDVSEQLVLVARELCNSPVLYFSHYRPTGQLILQAHAGLENIGALPALAFPMPTKAVLRFSDYEPLQNLILMRFGTAHFEGHPITAFGTLGRLAQKPQILGVLVVLHSNVDSALHQESLNRLMRTTGLIYENAVLAQ